MSYVPRVTERDVPLLRGLLESRVLLLEDIARLYFPSFDTARVRLQKLTDGKLISKRVTLIGGKRVPYFALSQRGYTELCNKPGGMDGFPDLSQHKFRTRATVAATTLSHELRVGTVRAMLEPALHALPQVTGLTYRTWPWLFRFDVPRKRGMRRMVTTQDADSFIHIVHADGDDEVDSYFYLEFDTGRMVRSRLIEKLEGYEHHYTSGGLAETFHHSPADFEQFGFVSLFVFATGVDRLYNMLEYAHCAGYEESTWMTTFDALKRDPLGMIWVRPIDYHEATQGTPYEPDPDRASHPSGQNHARTKFLADRLRRRVLI